MTINDLYKGAKIVNLPLVVVEIWFFLNITLWLPVWTGSKGQIGVTFLTIFFDNYRSVQFYKNCEFTSCGCWDMIFLRILNFDFRFGQEVKVKLGHFFINIFWQLTICTMVQQKCNLPLVVVEIWFFVILHFDFRFGQEVKVKLGSNFKQYFLTNNDYQKLWISCGCWDMIFLNIKFWFIVIYWWPHHDRLCGQFQVSLQVCVFL